MYLTPRENILTLIELYIQLNKISNKICDILIPSANPSYIHAMHMVW